MSMNIPPNSPTASRAVLAPCAMRRLVRSLGVGWKSTSASPAAAKDTNNEAIRNISTSPRTGLWQRAVKPGFRNILSGTYGGVNLEFALRLQPKEGMTSAANNSTELVTSATVIPPNANHERK